LSFDYSKLPHEYPRRYLPPNLDLADWTQLKGVFDELEKRPIRSKEELEKWLQDESEFYTAVSEEYAVRYVRMTCQTDDPEREKAYLHFVENIEPKSKPRVFNLDRKFVETPFRKQLSEWYVVLDRRRENNVALFRPENVELEKEEAKLGQEYEKTAGARTVFYEGKERTLQQMAQYLENVNRTIRQETWTLAEERRLKDRETMDQLYSKLISLRKQIAKNAGFENYRDYAFRRRERFDYSPQDCFSFHEAVEEHMVPLVRALDKQRTEMMSLDTLRPWDLAVDSEGRSPLNPFKAMNELAQRCERVFDRVHSDFGKGFRRMVELSLVDSESRRGKAPGAYCAEFPGIRMPFMFLNLVGRDDDVRTVLHESGHAFHTFATRNLEPHAHYRGENAPMEFAEVASMSMELLGGEQIEDTFYNHQDAMRSKKEHLESIVRLLPWVATIDAFQHWIYTNPDHTIMEREEFWLKLRDRFGGSESWDGLESIRRTFWQRQGHLFTAPFYYIEYGIAQLGALGIWTQYRKDQDEGIEAYKRALALGGSKPLPELFKAANLPFDFGPNIVQQYAQELGSELLGSKR
jgi:oligoendopeptidase F